MMKSIVLGLLFAVGSVGAEPSWAAPASRAPAAVNSYPSRPLTEAEVWGSLSRRVDAVERSLVPKQPQAGPLIGEIRANLNSLSDAWRARGQGKIPQEYLSSLTDDDYLLNRIANMQDTERALMVLRGVAADLRVKADHIRRRRAGVGSDTRNARLVERAPRVRHADQAGDDPSARWVDEGDCDLVTVTVRTWNAVSGVEQRGWRVWYMPEGFSYLPDSYPYPKYFGHLTRTTEKLAPGSVYLGADKGPMKNRPDMYGIGDDGSCTMTVDLNVP